MCCLLLNAVELVVVTQARARARVRVRARAEAEAEYNVYTIVPMQQYAPDRPIPKRYRNTHLASQRRSATILV